MAFGMTPQGFRIKRLADIKTEIENSLRASLGQGINLLPESVFGQIIGIVSERESLLWEQLAAIFNSQYPDTASDTQLDLVCSIVGVTRQVATRTRVNGELFFGTIGTTIPIGTQLSVGSNPLAIFETLAEVTLVPGTSAVHTLTFSVVPDSGSFAISYAGQVTSLIPYTANAAAVLAALEAVQAVGIGNVAVTGSFGIGFTLTYQVLMQKQPIAVPTIISNTLLLIAAPVVVTVTNTTTGVIQGTSDLEATVVGVVVAPQRSVTVIETPVFGLDATVNPSSGTTGRARETDAELRIRREQEIQIAGAGTLGAIFAQVSLVEDVESVIVFENDSDVVDGDGRPPHSVEVVVFGGDDAEIALTIFNAVAAGIATFGSESEIVVDSNGFTHTIYFSRPTVVELLLDWDLVIDPVFYPVNGDDLVKANSQAFINNLSVGQDVISLPDLLACLTGIPELAIEKIPGILRADLLISKKPTVPSGDANIAILVTEIARIDLADITVATI